MRVRRLAGRLPILMALMVLAGVVLALGFRPDVPADSAHAADDPAEVVSWINDPHFPMNAPAIIKDTYEYAATHRDEMKKYPCYCGCSAMGHTSALSCFVKDVGPNGAVVWDKHAAGCGICLAITQDVMRLKAEGKTSLETRQYIDATYSAAGPGTYTPLPTD